MYEAAVVFLLFFAVLAFAWFYVQRAKSRNAAQTTTTTGDVEPEAPASTTDRPA